MPMLWSEKRSIRRSRGGRWRRRRRMLSWRGTLSLLDLSRWLVGFQSISQCNRTGMLQALQLLIKHKKSLVMQRTHNNQLRWRTCQNSRRATILLQSLLSYDKESRINQSKHPKRSFWPKSCKVALMVGKQHPITEELWVALAWICHRLLEAKSHRTPQIPELKSN